MTAKEVKDECERIWNDEPLIYPCNLNWWNTSYGQRYGKFFVARGRRVNLNYSSYQWLKETLGKQSAERWRNRSSNQKEKPAKKPEFILAKLDALIAKRYRNSVEPVQTLAISKDCV